jgi:biopolymer transport protein ExbD
MVGKVLGENFLEGRIFLVPFLDILVVAEIVYTVRNGFFHTDILSALQKKTNNKTNKQKQQIAAHNIFTTFGRKALLFTVL